MMMQWPAALFLRPGLALHPFGVEARDDYPSLFDGKTLNGWSAIDPGYWSVADGAITARSTAEKLTKL